MAPTLLSVVCANVQAGEDRRLLSLVKEFEDSGVALQQMEWMDFQPRTPAQERAAVFAALRRLMRL